MLLSNNSGSNYQLHCIRSKFQNKLFLKFLSCPIFHKSGTPPRAEPVWQKVWFKVQKAEKVWHHQVYKWKKKKNTPHPTPPNRPPASKSCRHSGRALLQECCQLRCYYSTQSRLRGGERRLWESKRGASRLKKQPNIYPPLIKARPVHRRVMELPLRTAK